MHPTGRTWRLFTSASVVFLFLGMVLTPLLAMVTFRQLLLLLSKPFLKSKNPKCYGKLGIRTTV